MSVYVCKQCGSNDIEIPMWVNPNTNIPNGDYNGGESDNECYCNYCEEHTEYEEIDDDLAKSLEAGGPFPIDYGDNHD